MARPRFFRVSAALFAVTFLVPAAYAGSTGQVNFFLGRKALDRSDWAPVDDQGEFGAVMTFGRPEWPVHIAVDLLGSSDEGEIFDAFVGEIDVTGSTFELDFGARKIWGEKGFHPYVGGGIAFVNARVELDSSFGDVDDDEGAVGAWVGGGAFWRLGKKFNIGADLRFTGARTDAERGGSGAGTGAAPTNGVQAGGLHLGLLLGFGW